MSTSSLQLLNVAIRVLPPCGRLRRAFHTSAGSHVAPHCGLRRHAGARVQQMAGAGACQSILLRSVAVALLLSQVSALPFMLPSCCALCDANLKLCQRWNGGALTMRPHSSCLWMCWRSLCWTSHSMRLCHQRCRWMEEEEPRGEEQRDTRMRFSPDFVGEMGLER